MRVSVQFDDVYDGIRAAGAVLHKVEALTDEEKTFDHVCVAIDEAVGSVYGKTVSSQIGTDGVMIVKAEHFEARIIP